MLPSIEVIVLHCFGGDVDIFLHVLTRSPAAHSDELPGLFVLENTSIDETIDIFQRTAESMHRIEQMISERIPGRMNRHVDKHLLLSLPQLGQLVHREMDK